MRNHTTPPPRAQNQRHLPVRKRLSRDRHRHDFRLFISHERKGELGSLRGGVTALFRDLCPHPSSKTQTNICEAINTTEHIPGTKRTERLKTKTNKQNKDEKRRDDPKKTNDYSANSTHAARMTYSTRHAMHRALHLRSLGQAARLSTPHTSHYHGTPLPPAANTTTTPVPQTSGRPSAICLPPFLEDTAPTSRQARVSGCGCREVGCSTKS